MIFRKHISIFLTFFLLVSNIGLAFNVHYCGNEIVSVTVDKAASSIEAEKNCCGIVEKKSKCCNDKIIKVEVKSDQIFVKLLSFSPKFIFANFDWKPIVTKFNIGIEQSNCKTYHCNANAPPLYLLHSQYTFYC